MSTQEVEQGRPFDTFELRLAIARHHAGGLSASEAAMRVGVSGQTWRNWEHGQHSDAARRPAMLRYIAEQMGVSDEWLREGGPLASASTPPTPEGRTTQGYTRIFGALRNRSVTEVLGWVAA